MRSSSYAPGAAAARRRSERVVEPLEEQAHRLRVQDPGEHGSGASRPHRVHAPLLGPVRARHAAVPRAARQGDAHRAMRSPSWRPIAQQTDEAYAGDIIGLHNHGTINIGDTFTEGERLTFTGIPNFAPEMFRRAVLRDPLRMKALQKGLAQLCEEGATQLFRPLRNNDLILGAVGPAAVRRGRVPPAGRVRRAVHVRATSTCTPRAGSTARTTRKLEEFRAKAYDNLALDHAGALVYLAPSRVNLQLTLERWPDIEVPRNARAPAPTPRDDWRPDIDAVRRAEDHCFAPAGAVLGALRLGELRVRDHRDGGLLPDLLQAVLERRRRRDREHVPARARERHGRASWSRCSRRVLGAIADKGGARVRLLALFTVLGAAMTAGLLLRRNGRLGCWPPLLYARGLARILGRQSVLRFAAHSTSPSQREYDLVSGFGYSLGYLGGGLLFLVNVLMVTQPAMFGLADASAAVRVSFLDGGRLVARLQRAAAAVRARARAGCAAAVRARRSAPGCASSRTRCGICARDRTLLLVPARVLVLHRRRQHHHQDGGRLRPVARPRSRAA